MHFYWSKVLNILFLAIISEPIYDMAVYNTYFYPYSQNILFTLFTSLICMLIYEKSENYIISKIMSIFIIIYISLMTQIIYFDYGFLGMMLIFGFYLISKNNYNKKFYVLLILMYLLFKNLLNDFSYSSFGILLSLIFIFMYNHNKGYSSKIIKYLFYLYYPIHLLILIIFK